MKITGNNIIGQLVANDYRTAEIFGKYKIDFCCKGDRTVLQACEKKNIDSEALLRDLNRLNDQPSEGQINFRAWPADLLADYIEKKHHRYVEQKIPLVSQYLRKVSQVHGAAHPELMDICELFLEAATSLTRHMKKEELILFPYIRKMITSGSAGRMHFGSIENPISAMKEEHSDEGERFARIAELSSNYTPPEGACNTYRVTYALLKEFEQDLHTHIHLENNILFPQAIELEAQLAGQSCEI